MFAALLHWLFNFTSETTQLAAWWAVPAAVILAGGAFFWSGKRVVYTAVTAFSGGLAVLYGLKLWIYFVQPTYNGFLAGTFWLIFFTLLIGAIVGCISAYFAESSRTNSDEISLGVWASAGSFVVPVVVLSLTCLV